MVSMQQLSPRPSPARPPFVEPAPRSASDDARAESRSDAALALRVLLVEGDAPSEALLREVFARVDLCEVRRVSGAQLGLESAESARPPRALLFEVLDAAVSASAVLAAVRAERGLRALPALVALDSGRSDWLEQACAFDDFLLYPWSPDELLGRIRALEHRRQPGHDEVVCIGPVSVDEGTRMAHVATGRVQLTVREFALLSYLGLQSGRVLSREHLLEQVWGASYQGGRRTVDVHVRRLRAKLGTALRIETVRSGGYKLCLDPA